MSYVEALSRELDAVAIRGRRHERILNEIADHLRCDPDADLGAPDELARRFADELGTALTRRAVLVAFGSLVLAAVCVGIAFVTAQRLFVSAANTSSRWGTVGGWMAVIGAQVAIVAAGSAVLRTARHWRDGVVSRAEAVMLVRRAGVGLASGALTIVGFAFMALALVHHQADWWTALTLSLLGVGLAGLLLATLVVVAAGRLRPVAAGERGDLFDDLGPIVPSALRGRPWRFALVTALVAVVVVALAGVVQSDPYDGLMRALAAGFACLAGFAALGRYLGLRT